MILKSDIEADAKSIIEALKGDYIIPTSGQIVWPVIKVMSVVYLMHLVAYLISDIIYHDIGTNLEGKLVCFLLSCGILTVLALMMTYGNLSLLMCIPKAVRDKSLLIRLGKEKFKVYGCAIVFINVISAIVMINVESGFIVCYGFSWFACMLIGGITFSMSMSRYMTPAVVATLDKIRQVVSSEEIESSKPNS
jgi:hypothetical protein